MASQKIKKKSSPNQKASVLPRQGAIPCLVLIVILLIVLAVFFFGALRSIA